MNLSSCMLWTVEITSTVIRIKDVGYGVMQLNTYVTASVATQYNKVPSGANIDEHTENHSAI